MPVSLFPCARGILEFLILRRVPLDKLVAAQINLAFEGIPRLIRYPISDKFPIALLRYTAVLAKLLKQPVSAPVRAVPLAIARFNEVKRTDG